MMLPSRRDLLAAAPAAAVATATAAAAESSGAPSTGPALQLAHLTDLHIQPERDAVRGVAACLEHVQSLPERSAMATPELIITGGDTIMDALATGRDRAQLQWDLRNKTKNDHCGLEVRSVIGNHDVWGWTRSKAGTTGDEPGYGKAWACEQFGRATPWESFDKAGWHIVLLDSTFPHQESYIGKLDNAQWDWLQRDLAAVPAATPVLLVSHIPILSVFPLAVGRPQAKGTSLPAFQITGNLVHVDYERFRRLFAKHPNVKACLSGHLHIVETIDYGGVRYICNGAVAAGWWRGLHHGTDYGYALVDLFADGTVTSRYVPFGWTTQA